MRKEKWLGRKSVVWNCGSRRDWLQRGTSKVLGVIKIFYILIVVLSTCVCTFIKIRKIVPLKKVNFTVFKSYLKNYNPDLKIIHLREKKKPTSLCSWVRFYPEFWIFTYDQQTECSYASWVVLTLEHLTLFSLTGDLMSLCTYIAPDTKLRRSQKAITNANSVLCGKSEILYSEGRKQLFSLLLTTR